MTILSWSDVVTTAPSREPVSLQEAKRNADAASSNAHDQDFKRWITEARKQVERESRRSLITQTRKLTADCVPEGDAFRLPYGPVQSITSIQYTDSDDTTQTFSSSNYTLDTGRDAVLLTTNASWPSTGGSGRNAFIVTYVAGYGDTASDVPQAAISAMLLLITHRYENPYPVTDKATHHVDLSYNSLIQQLNPYAYP